MAVTIIYPNKNKQVRLCQLDEGEVFLNSVDQKYLWMKIEEGDDDITAICLNDGERGAFSSELMVTPVNIAITVEG